MSDNKHQSTPATDRERFWIIGAGRFGRIAVARISRHFPGAAITVVDQTPFEMVDEGITTIVADGIQWLKDRIHGDAAVEWIVPAIPIHVAAQWLRLSLTHCFVIHPVPIPDAWLNQLPHAHRGNAGQVFVSHADFICPDDCPEPRDHCSITGSPRPMDLFKLLGDLDVGHLLPIVVRSHQLCPGVGGITPGDLIRARDIACENSHRPLMIATACRCHGVVDIMRLERTLATRAQSE